GWSPGSGPPCSPAIPAASRAAATKWPQWSTFCFQTRPASSRASPCRSTAPTAEPQRSRSRCAVVDIDMSPPKLYRTGGTRGRVMVMLSNKATRRHVMALGAAALAAPAVRSARAQSKTLVIGGSVPLTGAAAETGLNVNNGYVTAVSYLNDVLG